jgi:hypothetical protein
MEDYLLFGIRAPDWAVQSLEERVVVPNRGLPALGQDQTQGTTIKERATKTKTKTTTTTTRDDNGPAWKAAFAGDPGYKPLIDEN